MSRKEVAATRIANLVQRLEDMGKHEVVDRVHRELIRASDCPDSDPDCNELPEPNPGPNEEDDG